MTRNLLKSLINASEKAANIARICRKDVALLSLLVEEKSADEKNPRFVKDFKTLADVLIQETVRNDIGKEFPELRDSIKGEESATFTNTLGDSITVVIGDCTEKTLACLSSVLNGNTSAADILSFEVHKDVICEVANNVPDLPIDLKLDELGIWIDPIDGTSEYIAGDTFFTSFPGITSTGLDCVTVLIGVYNKITGEPIIGVVNQPFHKKVDANEYRGEIFWGICINEIILNNVTESMKDKPNKIAILSASEHSQVKALIQSLNYEIAFSAGAGHKALKVITGEADLYLLTKSTTFKWDTCAPQAILKSLGGGMFDFRKSLKQEKPIPLEYMDNGEKCNSGGIIAVKNMNLLPELFRVLNE